MRVQNTQAARLHSPEPGTIKQHVRNHYSRLYASGRTAPSMLPIRCGRPLALELGYPEDFLELIPDPLWDLFAPCGNPLPSLRCVSGQRILNLGCGVGIDSFALGMHHPRLRVVGLDVVWDVLEKARRFSSTAAFLPASLSWVCADGEALPFAAQCFDAVVMNGVFNLFPDKPTLLEELQRVLKLRGQLIIADLLATTPLPDYFADEPDAWAWCMSGALTPSQLQALLRQNAFEQITLNHEGSREMLVRMVVSCTRS
jgi:arsenite methyltransferase